MDGIFQALRAKKQLSNSQRAVLETRQLSGTLTPHEWIETFRSLAEYDQACEIAKKQSIIFLITCIFIAILGLAVLQSPLMGGVFIFLSILFLIFMRNFQKGDLPNEFREIVGPTLSMLREDMKPSAPVMLNLDLRGAMHSSKQTNVTSDPAVGRTLSRKNHFYQDPWLTLKGKLVDKTAFELVCRCDTKETKIKKRSQSGKTKFKNKKKFKLLQSLTLKPDPLQYEAIQATPHPHIQTTLKPKEPGFAVQSLIVNQGTGKPSIATQNMEDMAALFATSMKHYQPITL